MRRNSCRAAIDLISSKGILRQSSHKSGISNHPFSIFCALFNTVSDKPRSNNSYNHDLGTAISLFHDMVRMQPQPSVVNFTKLLNSIVEMEHFTVALNLFDEMREWNVPLDEYIMNTAIHCYVRSNHLGFGFAMLGTFYKSGYEPIASTFTTLLKGLVLENKAVEAQTLILKLLREKPCEPNWIMFWTVMKGLCEIGHRGKARDLLRLLEKRCYKLEASTYNAIIDSFCKDKMFDHASKLISSMIEKGVKPNDLTYSSMIRGYIDVGRLNEVKDLLIEMQARKVTPRLMTCNRLLDGLCESHKVDEAFSVLSMMEKINGFKPDIVTYNILTKGLCRIGKLDNARKLLEELCSKGLSPNVKTFNTITSALCGEGLTKEAKDLVMNIETKGCLPNSVTYNVLLRGFLKRNEYHEAISVLDEMTKRGFKPDAFSTPMLLKVS